MNAVPTGIVLPESVLTSQWFLLLATVVAFNTVVYLGLTLAKLIPWPRQFHPAWVREGLARFGIHIDEESAMKDIPDPRPAESTDPYEALRLGTARRDIPQALGLAGGVTILFTLAGFVVAPDSPVSFRLAQLVVGVGFLLAGAAVGRSAMPTRARMWVWMVACVVLLFLLVAEAAFAGNQLILGYALILMTAAAPVALAWRPAAAGSLVMLFAFTAASLTIPGDDDLRLVLAGTLAVLVAALLLHLRLTAIDALSDERARSEALASTDPMTGVLTRHGLLSLMPGIAGTAERTSGQVCVVYVDIVHLARANREYGSAYGDDVLRAVADALVDGSRLGDLVARWGGDEFLVAGLGSRPDPVAMAQRIEERVALNGVNLGKWPTAVKVGTASGDPGSTTFEELVARAMAQVQAA